MISNDAGIRGYSSQCKSKENLVRLTFSFLHNGHILKKQKRADREMEANGGKE